MVGAAGAGLHGATAGDLGADGVHAWRVRVTDGAGNVALVAGPAGIVVDTTPPALTLHPLAEGWVNRAEIDLTTSDNLHGLLGLGAVEIDVNAAADGADTGEWSRRATVAGAPGRRTIAIDLRGLAEGRHALRVRVRNGGPAGARLVAEARGALRVDLTSPVIASASFSGGGAAPAGRVVGGRRRHLGGGDGHDPVASGRGLAHPRSGRARATAPAGCSWTDRPCPAGSGRCAS